MLQPKKAVVPQYYTTLRQEEFNFNSYTLLMCMYYLQIFRSIFISRYFKMHMQYSIMYLRRIVRHVGRRRGRCYSDQCIGRIKPIASGRTEWEAPYLSHSTPCFFMGSCFSQVIAGKLKHVKFPVFSNPFGIMFDPVSISNCLKRVVAGPFFDERDVFRDHFHPDIFHSWSHHSVFSHTNSELMLRSINKNLVNAREHIMKSNVLFVTLGTATVHCLRDDAASVVANCHKRESTVGAFVYYIVHHYFY
jgi:hypothetical protein